MADRTAAEPIADAQAAKIQAEKDLTDCRDALARAEQALAEAKVDAWDRGYFAQCHCGCLEARETVNPYSAALRASQGGQ